MLKSAENRRKSCNRLSKNELILSLEKLNRNRIAWKVLLAVALFRSREISGGCAPLILLGWRIYDCDFSSYKEVYLQFLRSQERVDARVEPMLISV